METSFPTTSPVKSTSRRKSTRLVAAFALVALLCIPEFLVILVQRNANHQSLHRGDLIPPLTLRSLNSTNLSFHDFAGKRLALVFFKVDCPHCQREMISINNLSALFEDEILFVGVSLSDEQNTKNFVSLNRTVAITLLDEKAEARHAFGILEVPAFFLVNANQTVEYRGCGEQSHETLRELLTAFAHDANQSKRRDSGD